MNAPIECTILNRLAFAAAASLICGALAFLFHVGDARFFVVGAWFGAIVGAIVVLEAERKLGSLLRIFVLSMIGVILGAVVGWLLNWNLSKTVSFAFVSGVLAASGSKVVRFLPLP